MEDSPVVFLAERVLGHPAVVTRVRGMEVHEARLVGPREEVAARKRQGGASLEGSVVEVGDRCPVAVVVVVVVGMGVEVDPLGHQVEPTAAALRW